MSYTVKIKGLDKLQSMFKTAPQKTYNEITRALAESGDQLVSDTVDKIKAKKLVDRGKLAQYTRTYPSGPLKQTIEVDAKYAVALEEGTGPFHPPISALKGWARRKLGNEKLAYPVAKSIAKKGIKPRYYHKEALDRSIPKIQDIFSKIFNRIYK
jgi:hypothetical protein